MLEGLQYDHSAKVFSDVRFVLLGFDPIDKPMVLSKLVDGGGVDVGRYGPICTHVIADKLLYDDPICVAARSDGKTIVNGLWVAHSFDVGMPVDPTSIMYRPLRDLQGIPGAKSLVVCLTGYQRQDREDIMTMVSLMGANFSKPLVANKVTHLICYKFEGEKYELAKKMKKIKLVNHLWLEDCLKAWEILPEVDYDKSGYELEVLEAEAKDSEEETDVCGEPVKTYERTAVPVTVGNDLASTSGSERSPHSDTRKLSPKSYSRKTMYLGGMTGHLSAAASTVNTGNYNMNYGSDISMTEKLKDGTDISCFRTPKGTRLHPEEQSSILDEKREMDVSCGNSKSQKTGHNPKAHISAGSMEMTRSELLEPASLISGTVETSNHLFSNNDAHYSSLAAALNTPQRSSAKISKLMSSSVGRKSPASGMPILKMFNSEIRQDGKLEEALQINSAGLTKGRLESKPVSKYVVTGEAPKISSPRSKKLEIEKSNDAPNLNLHADAHLKPPTRKMFGRKSWSKGNTINLKGSIYLNKNVSDDPTICSIGGEEAAGHEKLEMFPPTVNHTVLGEPTNDVSQSRNKVQQRCMSMDDETEAPEYNEENEVREAVREEKYREDEPDIIGEDDKSEDLQTNETDGNALGVHGYNMTVGKDKDGTMQQKATCGKTKPGKSIHTQKVEKENISRGKKRPLSKINKTTVPSNVPEAKEVPEGVSEENYGVVEAEIIGVEMALGVHSHKASAEEKHGTKEKRATCGKRKLEESPHMEKAVKESTSRGGKRPPSKLKKTTIPSEVLGGKVDNEVPGALCEEKNGEVEPDIVGNVGAEDKSEEVQTYKTECNALGVHTHKSSGEDKDGSKQKKTTCGKRKLGQFTHMEDVEKEKKNAGQKRPLNKIRKGTGLSVAKIAAIEESESENNEGSTPHPAGKKKRTESINEFTQSVVVEKENMAVSAGDQNVSCGKKWMGKLASKASRKIDTEASKSNLDKGQVLMAPKPEPVWFILTGHKLQRKEFQQIIRRLKGKVCKVSHQWSYQATHFIVPDPVRRTEKFFAAAASGRWILKTDFLSDSNREGKFLAEEPYEWYQSGLSEDGAINLEAPRKWRLQRERTDHGAFYKMSIIIYGECISPSLDTLKRVVKAGDGTILATSPPYTRILESGVDFAVVSPGMPRVDMWVQEFLRHEIPCVLADYLVEFVCKPGYSLERHVQYNTHGWAEKALKNLVKQSEEIVGLMTPLNDDGGNDCSDSDLPCRVCGLRDRGEEMLICGDESGSTGCGIGMHIDCCDPPLADVPEEDWFCPKCSESSRKKPPKSAKKGTPVSKRK